MDETQAPRRFPWLTLLMLAANLAAYGWQGLKFGHFGSFSESELMQVGANVAALSATGDYWRLLSSLFIHASLGHLLSNMLALLFIGAALETLIARWQWLLIYLAGGVFAGLVSAIENFDITSTSFFMQEVRTVYLSVGASGAIMSLSSAMAVLALFRIVVEGEDSASTQLLKGALLFALLNLGYGFFSKSIDNAAHIGGLVFGLLAGAMLVAPHWPAGLLTRLAAGVVPPLVIAMAVFNLASKVTRNPDAGSLREMAANMRGQALSADPRQHPRQDEPRETVASVPLEEAIGVVVPLGGVVRIVATRDPQRVYLLKNDNESRIIEYDLARNAPLRTLVDRRYDGRDLWGCPAQQCLGVGVSDLQLDETAGKAYVSSLVKGAVSRVDLASGAIDYSVATGRFPSRLLLRDKRLYAFDRTDHSLSVVDAERGRLLRKIKVAEDSQGNADWPRGEDMVFSEDGKSIYLLTTDGQLMRASVDTASITRVNAQDAVLALGKNGLGKVWALYADGIDYPDVREPDKPRKRIPYSEVNGMAEPATVGFMDPDGQHPLILHRHGGMVLGVSARSGQLLRVFPQTQEEENVFSIAALDGRRFYLPGRQATQVLDVEKSIAIEGEAKVYQQRLEEALKFESAGTRN